MRSDRTSSENMEVDTCTCDPCECELSGTKNATSQLEICTCYPCECDLPESRDGLLPGSCKCDPCECDPGEISSRKESYQRKSTVPPNTSVECNCDPCECDLPEAEETQIINYERSISPPSALSGEFGQPRRPSVDGWLASRIECTCDPCLCEPQAGSQSCNSGPRRFTLPPTPEASEHMFENLNTLRRNFCREYFPKNLGVPLTEDVLLDILIKNPSGELEMLLPGNQIYPGFLSRRICDDDVLVIVNVLLEIRGIVKVNLCYNEITDKGMDILAPAIQECANVVDLNLMHNNLTGSGVLALSKALMHRAPLQCLKLTGMKIGDEGVNALTCLVLSGRVPFDLDISECDLGVEGFQGICSALSAMDHDVDYPNYLLLRNDLPIDLVKLKELKAAYNDEVSQVSQLNRKASLPNIVRVIDNREDRLPSVQLGEGESNGLFEVFESFSATILQGLFDLRHRFSEDDLSAQEMKIDTVPSTVGAVSGVLQLEVDEVVEKFHRLRAGETLAANSIDELDMDSQMISRSLYSLDVVDEEVLLMDADRDLLDEDESSELDPSERHHQPPDVYTAEAAATFVMKETEQAVAKHVVSSDYRGQSDITQLVLMTVLETIEKINSKVNLTEDNCFSILEDAMQKVYEMIFPPLAPDSGLSKADVMVFFKVLLSASQGTFMKLFENPFITQAIIEHGSKASAGKAQKAENKIVGQKGAMTEEQIYHIASCFLKGVIIEAARMVGVASPFGIQEDVNKDLACTELKIEGTVDDLFNSAATLAACTKNRAEKLEEIYTDFKASADRFVVELFESVHKLITEAHTKTRTVVNEDMRGPSLYEFVARPVRLVFNRPFFRDSSHIMAAKLGDFLATNTTVTALHIRKWILGEDGMIALMEAVLSRNTTLVVLDLACNQLGADGMKLLAIYITQNKNLKHLLLGNNRIRDAGMAFLNRTLTESSLVSLDITNNQITHRQLDHFLTILPLTKVRAIFVWGNKFGPSTWNIIKTLLEQEILNPGYMDIVLEKADDQRMVVKNMQIRDVNEYYEVPAILDRGLRLPPVFIDDSYKTPSRFTSPVNNVLA